MVYKSSSSEVSALPELPPHSQIINLVPIQQSSQIIELSTIQIELPELPGRLFHQTFPGDSPEILYESVADLADFFSGLWGNHLALHYQKSEFFWIQVDGWFTNQLTLIYRPDSQFVKYMPLYSMIVKPVFKPNRIIVINT